MTDPVARGAGYSSRNLQQARILGFVIAMGFAAVLLVGRLMPDFLRYKNLVLLDSLAHPYWLGGIVTLFVGSWYGWVRGLFAPLLLIGGVAVACYVVTLHPEIPSFAMLTAGASCGWGALLGAGFFPSPATAEFRRRRNQAYREARGMPQASSGLNLRMVLLRGAALVVLAACLYVAYIRYFQQHDLAMAGYAACGLWGWLASFILDRLLPIGAGL